MAISYGWGARSSYEVFISFSPVWVEFYPYSGFSLRTPIAAPTGIVESPPSTCDPCRRPRRSKLTPLSALQCSPHARTLAIARRGSPVFQGGTKETSCHETHKVAARAPHGRRRRGTLCTCPAQRPTPRRPAPLLKKTSNDLRKHSLPFLTITNFILMTK